MTEAIIYIKFIGDHDNFNDWKNKSIERQKGILKYLKKQWEIPSEEDSENEEDKFKIYEGKLKAWDLLIISLTYIPFGLVSKCNENAL